LAAETEDRERVLVSLAFDYERRASLQRETEQVENVLGARFTVLTWTPGVQLALDDQARFFLRLRTPIHHKIFEEPALRIENTLSGLGDAEVLADYELDTEVFGVTWRAIASAGLATPTGAAARQPFVGTFATTPLQLGGGTWDPLAAIALSVRPARSLAIEAASSARFVLTANSHRYRSPQVIEAALGAAVRTFEVLSLRARVSATHLGRSEVDGEAVPATGRTSIAFAAEVEVDVFGRVLVSVGARLPLWTRVNEVQLADAIAIGTRIGVTL
jgi:hypothetical protein